MSDSKKRIEPSFSVDAIDLSTNNANSSHSQNDQQSQLNRGGTASKDSSSTSQVALSIALTLKKLLATLLVAISQIITQHKKASIYVVSIFILLLIVAWLFTLFNNSETASMSSNTPATTINQTNESAILTGMNNTQYSIVFQDNFSLQLSAFNGVIINWQGEETEDSLLWDIRRTTGNQACQTMQFNNKKYNTLHVVNNDMKGYLAYFSPVDTKHIIQSLARKNAFTLCGYEFSLKGSQALLGKHAYYSELLAE